MENNGIDIDAIYAAGLMDADGTFVIFFSKHPNGVRGGHFRAEAALQIREKFICDWMKNTFGGSVTLIRSKNPKHSDIYHWKSTGKHIEDFLRRIYPYAKIKQAQIRHLLDFRNIRKGCNSSIVTEEQWKQMLVLKESITNLNMKGKG